MMILYQTDWSYTTSLASTDLFALSPKASMVATPPSWCSFRRLVRTKDRRFQLL